MSVVNSFNSLLAYREPSISLHTEKEAALTMMHFNDTLTELVRKICEADPKGKAHAMQQLRDKTAPTDRATLRLVSLSDEEELFDNLPV